MRVIEMTAPGGPDVLTLADRPSPIPGPGQVRLKVHAAGVNRPDLLQRMGLYPPPPGASDLLGLEVAGTIEAMGADVSGPWAVGDRVMALLGGGGYAEFAVADARHLLALPPEMSFVQGAGVPETLFTVWANVVEAGGLAPGQTLFVHGATSGIGTMAASLANALGARCYGTAGSDEKCAAAVAAGFTDCFDYRAQDWSALMQAAGGADVVLDMVGGDYIGPNLALLKDGGRHVSIAFLRGIEGSFSIFEVMRRRLTLTGSTLRGRSDAEKARLTQQIQHQVGPMLATGQVAPIIDSTLPLDQAMAAHQRMEAGAHIGKIILTL